MARVRGPLMSMEASGNFAGQFQFRHNRYGGHVYKPPVPSTQNQRPATKAQALVRARYAAGRLEWNGLEENVRSSWAATARARKNDVTGFNLFMAAWMTATPPEPPVCVPYFRPNFDAANASWASAEPYTRPAFDAGNTQFQPLCA